jgi:hypothetical protein
MTTYAIQNEEVRKLTKLVEESTRATKESIKYFIEPTPGVLDKAKNKRHHIIFGRRGSGKSSLLHKIAADLTVSRTPIAYVDLEQFKGHSYPDVLISVLITTLKAFAFRHQPGNGEGARHRQRHSPACEPKGATYTALKVAQDRGGMWSAACMCDGDRSWILPGSLASILLQFWFYEVDANAMPRFWLR